MRPILLALPATLGLVLAGGFALAQDRVIDWLPATGSKGPITKIISKRGLGTASAEVRAVVTPEAIRENCANFSGGSRQQIDACVARITRDGTYAKPYVARANCPARTIQSSWGERYTLVGHDRDGKRFEPVLWQDARGKVLDGSNASSAPALTGQFAVLCQGGNRDKVEALARSLPTPAAASAPRLAALTGTPITAIPAAFRGDWGQPEACRAKRSGAVTDWLPFAVEPNRFGDFGVDCRVKSMRQVSATEIGVLAQCSEEGGLDEGDDGMRRVTLRLATSRTLITRFERPGERAADAQTTSMPRCER
jgi:hypothetical protein